MKEGFKPSLEKFEKARMRGRNRRNHSRRSVGDGGVICCTVEKKKRGNLDDLDTWNIGVIHMYDGADDSYRRMEDIVNEKIDGGTVCHGFYGLFQSFTG